MSDTEARTRFGRFRCEHECLEVVLGGRRNRSNEEGKSVPTTTSIVAAKSTESAALLVVVITGAKAPKRTSERHFEEY